MINNKPRNSLGVKRLGWMALAVLALLFTMLTVAIGGGKTPEKDLVTPEIPNYLKIIWEQYMLAGKSMSYARGGPSYKYEEERNLNFTAVDSDRPGSPDSAALSHTAILVSQQDVKWTWKLNGGVLDHAEVDNRSVQLYGRHNNLWRKGLFDDYRRFQDSSHDIFLVIRDSKGKGHVVKTWTLAHARSVHGSLRMDAEHGVLTVILDGDFREIKEVFLMKDM